MELKEVIYKYAVKNALEFGKADANAVLGKIIREKPELKGKIRETIPEIEITINSVNQKSREELEKEIAKFEFVEEKREKKGLPELSLKEGQRVRLRFAPNPNGPLHIGHARAAVLNDEYAKHYKGDFILRIEDTDPKRVDPEAYEMIREDVEWLGIKVSEEYRQSDRLEIYYKRAQELIKKGHAYVCTCREEEFKLLREKGIACRCRDKSAESNLDEFEKMKNEYREGEAVLRLKTDLKHENVSIRDFPLMRIVETEHPLAGDKRLYPLMNFSVSVDDYEMKLSHILRGKDHIINTEKQKIIFDYFGWEAPFYIHYGLLSIEGVFLSTSEMKKGIEEKVYAGWNDIKLGTLRAIARRGIRSDAIRRAMLDVGIKDTDITFSWEHLYAYNKEIIDKIANRYFFVDEPKILKVKNSKSLTAKMKLHPSVERGYREVEIGEGEEEFLISSSDFDEMKKKEIVRLMGAYNIEIDSKKGNAANAKFLNEDLDFAREKGAKLIHWVLKKEAVPCKVMAPDKTYKGFCEKSARNANSGEVVQFERFGFAVIEKKNGEIEAVFAHK